jgi:hypothetical protein
MDLDSIVILKLMLNWLDTCLWTSFIGSRHVLRTRGYERSNEILDSFYYLSNF